MLALTLSVCAYCAIAVTVMVAVPAGRGHHIGRPGTFVGIASGVTGLGLSGVAVLASSAVLPMVAGGAIGGALAPIAWVNAHWTGTCLLGAVLVGTGLLIAGLSRRTE